jgi:hypothetical protein
MHKVTKRISPDNTPSENRKLAQVGEFWETTEFVQAWHWRYMLLLCNQPEAANLTETKAETLREIGEVVGKAVAEGNWRYLESLAKAVAFVNDRFEWNVTGQEEIMELGHWDASKFKFKPVDPLRTLIITEYFMCRGDAVDKAKKARKTFMPYIAAMLGREVNGAFEKAFGRACKEVGIKWRK